MLLNNNYKEKELDIYMGVIRLLEEGNNPYHMTVSEIAHRANVGKGTIYEYFESKEDAIANSLIYFINLELSDIIESMSQLNNFKDKYYKLLDIIFNNKNNKLSVSKVLLSIGVKGEFYNSIVSLGYNESMFYNITNKLIKDLIKTGKQERIIDNNIDNFYMEQVIKGSIFSFYHYVEFYEFEDIDKKKAMNVSYEIVSKHLK